MVIAVHSHSKYGETCLGENQKVKWKYYAQLVVNQNLRILTAYYISDSVHGA